MGMNILKRPNIILITLFAMNIKYCPCVVDNPTGSDSTPIVLQYFPPLTSLYELCGMSVNDPKLSDLERWIAQKFLISLSDLERWIAQKSLISLDKSTHESVGSARLAFTLLCILEGSSVFNCIPLLRRAFNFNKPYDTGSGIIIPCAQIDIGSILEILATIFNSGLIPYDNMCIEFLPNDSKANLHLLQRKKTLEETALLHAYLDILQELIPKFKISNILQDKPPNINIKDLVHYLKKGPTMVLFNNYKSILSELINQSKLANQPSMQLASKIDLYDESLFQVLFEMDFPAIFHLLYNKLKIYSKHLESIDQEKELLIKKNIELTQSFAALPLEAYRLQPNLSQEGLSILSVICGISANMLTKTTEAKLNRYKILGQYFKEGIERRNILAKELALIDPRSYQYLLDGFFKQTKYPGNNIEKKHIKDRWLLSKYLRNEFAHPQMFAFYLENYQKNDKKNTKDKAFYISHQGKLSLSNEDISELKELNVGDIPNEFRFEYIKIILCRETNTVQFYYKPYDVHKALPIMNTDRSSASSSGAQSLNVPTIAEFAKIGQNASNSNLVFCNAVCPEWKIIYKSESGHLIVKQDIKAKGDHTIVVLNPFINGSTNLICLNGTNVKSFVHALQKAQQSGLIASFSEVKPVLPKFAYFIKIVDANGKLHIRMYVHNKVLS